MCFFGFLRFFCRGFLGGGFDLSEVFWFFLFFVITFLKYVEKDFDFVRN